MLRARKASFQGKEADPKIGQSLADQAAGLCGSFVVRLLVVIFTVTLPTPGTEPRPKPAQLPGAVNILRLLARRTCSSLKFYDYRRSSMSGCG